MDNLNRYQYQMSATDLGTLLDASGVWPGVPIGYNSESVKLAWAAIGRKLGFDPSTVIQTCGSGNRFFSAIPIETEEQRKTREMAEYKKERLERIYKLKQEIEALVTELRILEENQ